MAKKENLRDLNRLCDVIVKSRMMMEPQREQRLRITRHLAGANYSENANEKKIYIQLLGLYLSITTRTLCAKNPRVLLNTFDRSQMPTVTSFQDWANEDFENMDLAGTLKRIITDAGVGPMGIAKVGIATPSDVTEMSPWGLRTGSPFIRAVDFDDWVWDMNAREPAAVRFSGHRYRMVKEEAEANPLFDKKARQNLTLSLNDPRNHGGDEKISMIGRGYQGGFETELDDMVDLYEIYVPADKMIYTLAEDDLTGPNASHNGPKVVPLRAQEWLGPECGPYHFLTLGVPIPGNLMPKGPCLDLIDLAEAANETVRKLVRQAARQKDVTVVRDETDAKRAGDVNDGGFLLQTDPKNVQAMSMGGPNQGLHLFARDLISRFSWAAGNLETMGGLAPQAGTLGQEQLLAGNSSGQVADMQDTTLAFVAKLTKSYLWWCWADPSRVTRSQYSPPGAQEYSIERRTYPWHHPDTNKNVRSGEMPWLRVDPYSMRVTTPEQRVNTLLQTVTQIYVPLAQEAQRQGITLDLQELFEILSQYKDMPEIQRILTFQKKVEEEEMPVEPQQPGMPPNTSREYVRRSIGNQSPAAQQGGMDAMLMGGATNGPMNGSMK